VHARRLLIGASERVFSSPRLRLIPYDFVDESGDPEPRQIDLLALTAGDYSWIRLKVNAARGLIDSYIDLLDDTRHSLYVPSGSQSGLKLNHGFNVPEDRWHHLPLISICVNLYTIPPILQMTTFYGLLCSWWMATLKVL